MMHALGRWSGLLPGLVLSALVTAAAYVGSDLEARLVGRAWIEALVLAILLGTALRTAWTIPPRYEAGIGFSAKTLLETAVVLLGLSVGTATVTAAGPLLLAGVAVIVAATLAVSYGIGRGFGLPHKIAMLIACGNAICGNSAIAAAAPAIHAERDDVAASIAFTAVLGVAVVVMLPLVAVALHLTQLQYGVFAGLTVYAVPQVIAATAPVGAVSVQIGTLVKLVRVLMLAPVLLVLSLTAPVERATTRRPVLDLRRHVPGFVLGFLAMIALRATGFVPASILPWASGTAGVLTVMAMAALGLGVDARLVARAGLRVTAVVVLSLLALAALSLLLIAAIGPG